MDPKKSVLNELQVTPGIGKSIAVDLWELGIRRVGDPKGKSPKRPYEKRCR